MTLIHAVILAGGLRPAPIAEAVGVPVPCLPLVPDWSMLGLWCCTLDRLAAAADRRCRVSFVVSSERDRVAVQGCVDACAAEHGAGLTRLEGVEVRAESSRWRGTGGMVRDLVQARDAAELDAGALDAILVIEGGAVPIEGLDAVLPVLLGETGLGRDGDGDRDRDGDGDTDQESHPHVRGRAEHAADAVIGVAPRGVPAGVIAMRPTALDFIPSEGFCDLKEQLLPELHRVGRGALPVPLDGAVARVRSLAGYLAAVRATSGREPLVHSSARIADDALLDGMCLVGRDVVIESGACIQDAVLMDGCRVEGGAIVARSVVGAGAVVDSGMIWRDRVVRSRASRPSGKRGRLALEPSRSVNGRAASTGSGAPRTAAENGIPRYGVAGPEGTGKS